MFLRERLIVRIEEAQLDRVDDMDLNPHLQLSLIAAKVVDDLVEYLLWLTTHVFKTAGPGL